MFLAFVLSIQRSVFFFLALKPFKNLNLKMFPDGKRTTKTSLHVPKRHGQEDCPFKSPVISADMISDDKKKNTQETADLE